jgi:hypothetical protein
MMSIWMERDVDRRTYRASTTVSNTVFVVNILLKLRRVGIVRQIERVPGIVEDEELAGELGDESTV